MQKEFIISILSRDGKLINMQVKQKHQKLSKRKVRTWTAQQDKKLLDVYEQFPKRWTQIASHMPDRNQNQCLHRYRRLIQLGQNHKIWSAEEDQTILKMLKKYGKNWKLISEMLGTKNGKQIRERFINKLDPKIKRQDWSEQQDRQILQMYSKMGSKWSQISKYIPGRPQNKIKNRFYSYISKNYNISFKQVENIDPKYQIINENTQLIQQKKIPFESSVNKSRNIFQLKMQNRQSNDNIISKFQIPSINQIDFDIKVEHQQSHNNLLEYVFRGDDDWRHHNHYNSILELKSQDFFPKCNRSHQQ